MAKYKKPPARIRYEQNHPTVSFRLDLETKKRLAAALEGQSFASFIKEALGVKEKEAKDLKAERQKAYRQGYTAAENQVKVKAHEQGYAKAEKEFKVTFPCDICGEPIPVAHENTRQAIKQYMKEHGWGHNACHEKAKRRSL